MSAASSAMRRRWSQASGAGVALRRRRRNVSQMDGPRPSRSKPLDLVRGRGRTPHEAGREAPGIVARGARRGAGMPRLVTGAPRGAGSRV